MCLDVASNRLEAKPRATGAVAVVCESTACLPAELIERYSMTVVPVPFVFGEELFYDGVDITPATFYERLLTSSSVPKTSPPSPGAYLEAWGAAARHGDAVLSVTVDSKVSTFQRSAALAQGMAPELLPGVSVAVVDSLSAGMGQGFVALAAARAAAEGQSLAAVAATARRMADRVRLIVTLDTLEYLAKTARIPQVAALVSGFLAIKPIIQISNGEIRPLARVRTRRRSIDALLEYMAGMTPAGARLHVAVQHARAAEEAAALAERIRGGFACRELYITEFTPVMGGYCGPGLLGIAFYAEEEGDHAG